MMYTYLSMVWCITICSGFRLTNSLSRWGCIDKFNTTVLYTGYAQKTWHRKVKRVTKQKHIEK